MSQPLKNLNVSTKFLSSDSIKEIIYKNTNYTEDTLCTIKKEKLTKHPNNLDKKCIHAKSYETGDAYDTYYDETILINKELKSLEINHMMVYDNYNIDSSSMKYTIDIE
jgi:hypothetical protein